MQKQEDHWQPSVFQSSPIIQQLIATTADFLDFKQWPDINDYKNAFIKHALDITPVPQSSEINTFEELYEPRVYLKKELQTRTQNWHDFFNAMIWLNFPNTKKVLNQLHYLQAKQRPQGSNRSTLENRITQFDECGAIIISNRPELLEMVKQHQWQALFIDNQHQFNDNFRCIVFGHAIFEKSLSPYIGMTCHCLLLNNEAILDQVKQGDYTQLDKYLAQNWSKLATHNSIKLDPFPILGLPGYWPEQNLAFYQNKSYFR